MTLVALDVDGWMVVAVDPADVKQKKKEKKSLRGWVVVDADGRTAVVLLKLRVSNKGKKKKKKKTQSMRVGTSRLRTQ